MKIFNKKSVIIGIAVAMSGMCAAQNKPKIAVLEPWVVVGDTTITRITNNEKIQLFMALQETLSQLYDVYAKPDIQGIIDTLAFQQNWYITLNEKRQIRKISGTNIICVAYLGEAHTPNLTVQLEIHKSDTDIETVSRSLPRNGNLYKEYQRIIKKLMRKTIGKYVEIAGVCWATNNVGKNGEFTPSHTDKGNLYTWEDAKNACPAGWRLPYIDEIESLQKQELKFTDVGGKWYGNECCDTWRVHDKIFLPYTHTQSDGYYWSYNPLEDAAYYMSFTKNSVLGLHTGNRNDKKAVRCVCEE